MSWLTNLLARIAHMVDLKKSPTPPVAAPLTGQPAAPSPYVNKAVVSSAPRTGKREVSETQEQKKTRKAAIATRRAARK